MSQHNDDADNLTRCRKLADDIVQEMTVLSVFGSSDPHMMIMQIASDMVDSFRANTGPANVRFWYHPESECCLTTYGEQQHEGAYNEGCEEISIDQWDEYRARCIAADEDDEL